MTDFTAMTIDGRDADASGRIAVRNPADGAVFAEVPDAGEAELDAAVAAATRAFPGWAATPWAERQAHVAGERTEMGPEIVQ